MLPGVGQAEAYVPDTLCEPIVVVLCLGAGDITKWAARLPDELQAAREQVNA